MFERYTEKARRVIDFARSEALEHGAESIDPEHLLLGMLHENQDLFTRLLQASGADIRGQVEALLRRGERLPADVALPLSDASKRVLRNAFEEWEGLRHRHLGPGHLLLGLLREEGSAAERVLRGGGARLSSVRQRLREESERR